jgi:hypothetical protein
MPKIGEQSGTQWSCSPHASIETNAEFGMFFVHVQQEHEAVDSVTMSLAALLGIFLVASTSLTAKLPEQPRQAAWRWGAGL